MKHLLFLLALIGCLALPACSDNSPKATAKADADAAKAASAGSKVPATADSATLRVAIVTVADCLPVYVAEKSGLFKQLGLNVSLKSFNSQMDCDTAMWNGWADIAYADRTRLREHRNARGRKGQEPALWRELKACNPKWSLVASGTLRLKSAKSLKGRTLATARFAASDACADKLLNEAGVKPADSYRAQINDLELRARMLKETQVDAALLPEPYAARAIANGAKLLAQTTAPEAAGTFIAVRKTYEKRAESARQIELFLKALRMADDSIRIKKLSF